MDRTVNELINIFSYERYELENRRDSNVYIYPVITPIEGCDREPIKVNSEFFDQPMFPLTEGRKNDYSIDEIASIMAVATQGLTKYEANSPYKFHRPVPSARGLHPCEMYFFSNSGIRRYNPVENSFDVLLEAADNAGDAFSIVIAADDWRLGKFYGDFAYILSLLDAGHIIGNIATLAAKLDCSMELIYSKAQVTDDSNYCEYFKEQNLIVLVTIRIKKDQRSKVKLAPGSIKGSRAIDYKEFTQKLNFRQKFMELKHIDQLCEDVDRRLVNGDKNSVELVDNMPIRQILLNRTSAHSHIGLMSFDVLVDAAEKTNWIAQEIGRYVLGCELEKYVDVYLYNNASGSNMERGYYKLVWNNRGFEKVCGADSSKEEWHRIIHDSHEFLNVESIPFVFFTGVNIEAISQDYADRSIDVMYMLSGEISQIICLLSTRYGWFCRPIKNIQEKNIEGKLCVDTAYKRITYAMLAGEANIVQDTTYIDLFGRNSAGE